MKPEYIVFFVIALITGIVSFLTASPTTFPESMNAHWTVKEITENQNVCIVRRHHLHVFLRNRQGHYEIDSIAPADFLCRYYIVVEKELK